MAGAAPVAAGGAHPTRARGDHGPSVDGVGQESDPEADGLHDEDQVCGGDGAQSGRPTPTRPPPVDGPTALPPGAGGSCDVLHRSPEGIPRCGGQEPESTVPGLTETGGQTAREQALRQRETAPQLYLRAGSRGATPA